MSTQLQIVNSVLRRLRENTVASVADNAYSQLLAEWINDGVRQCQEAYDWPSLRRQVRFDIVAGQKDYDLSATVDTTGDVVSGDPVTTDDSLLRYDSCGRPLVYVYENASTDVPKSFPVMKDPNDIIAMRQRDKDYTDDEITAFGIQLRNGGGYQIKVYPTPSAARRVEMYWTIPQEALAIDGTDNATQIVVPSAPVEAYVHMIAANERGEEIGEPGNLLERRYIQTLGGAIEASMNAEQRTNRYESWRD